MRAWQAWGGRLACWALAVSAVSAATGGVCAAQTAAYDPRDFQREVFKTRFEREVRFRAAAIQVAWSAERLCDATTEIEPFVLWSLGTTGRDLSSADRELFSEVTGMDDPWRVAWLDEGAPEALHVGDVVVAVNDRPLPGGSTRCGVTGTRQVSCTPTSMPRRSSSLTSP